METFPKLQLVEFPSDAGIVRSDFVFWSARNSVIAPANYLYLVVDWRGSDGTPTHNNILWDENAITIDVDQEKLHLNN